MLIMRILLILLFAPLLSFSQHLVTPSTRWTSQLWDARWITGDSRTGVYLFRKTFDLSSKPTGFVIHLSADNRYRLLVNGKHVSDGPQMSDLRHWRFESLDIADVLQQGPNTLAIQVWNLGDAAPVYEMGKRLALIVQGEDETAKMVNTDKSWKITRNPALTPIPFGPGNPELFHQYYAAGPMDRIDGSIYPWGWEQPGFDDSSWTSPQELERGIPFQTAPYGDPQWELLPRSLPLMERTWQNFHSVRRTEGMNNPGLKFPLTVPFKQKVKILLDQGTLTTAFPEWAFSGGRGREIKITYAEGLFKKLGTGNRDSVEGKVIKGVNDLLVMDGGKSRVYTTLSYRAFRYVELEISSGEEPLIIEKMGSWFTGYPFKKLADFRSSDPALSKVFDIGWHTARLCSYDTYMDCPYWERLQYIGDTRIQALVSYAVSGDDRLARNAIEQFYWSLQHDGLTYSRYPSELPQYIPNYSLAWVLMIHDFMMYRNDPAFVKQFLPGVRLVMDHFKSYMTPDGMMGLQPYWDFLDHTYRTREVYDKSLYKRLATNSLFYAYTLGRAADLFLEFKDDATARTCIQWSQQLKESVQRQCWDGASGLYADTPDKNTFSMHVNILAILCGMMTKDEQEVLLKKITSAKNITPTTLYFDFYLGRAMNQAGTGSLYMSLLSKWKDLLSLGLTTFPEGVTRSDCHAWSASPDFEMLSTFAGIRPQVFGFRKVLIRPDMDALESVDASMAHWAGKITVRLEKKGKGVKGLVVLPPEITGRFEWGNSVVELKPGENEVLVGY